MQNSEGKRRCQHPLLWCSLLKIAFCRNAHSEASLGARLISSDVHQWGRWPHCTGARTASPTHFFRHSWIFIFCYLCFGLPFSPPALSQCRKWIAETHLFSKHPTSTVFNSLSKPTKEQQSTFLKNKEVSENRAGGASALGQTGDVSLLLGWDQQHPAGSASASQAESLLHSIAKYQNGFSSVNSICKKHLLCCKFNM